MAMKKRHVIVKRENIDFLFYMTPNGLMFKALMKRTGFPEWKDGYPGYFYYGLKGAPMNWKKAAGKKIEGILIA